MILLTKPSSLHQSIVVFLLCSFVLLPANHVEAQTENTYRLRSDEPKIEWIEKMYAASPDPGIVMALYNDYYSKHAFVKNQHTQYYKRWISGLGKTPKPDPVNDPVYLRKYEDLKSRRMPAQWTPIGPFDWDHDAAGKSYAPGSAHIYTVEQSFSNPDVLYAGTANAGIWKSIDHGLSWDPLTDNLLTASVTAIEINPSNNDIVYAGLLQSVYKTVNGGSSWNQTGDIAFQSLSLGVKDIRCHPDEPYRVFAATSGGLFRSVNSGSSWSNIMSGDILEIEFHPANPDTIYIVRRSGPITEFFRSLNGGNTFIQFTAGWPSPNVGAGEHQERTEIAVTPDAANNIYALATGSANGGSGLYGIYKSTDLGANWTFTCCGPGPGGPPGPTNQNLMGWSDQGLDDGGQYYYDLAFAVSPYNKDSMWVCGVNLWVSGNEGSSFVCPAAWSHSNKPNYVHADIHDLHYMETTGELWLAGDGGIFYSNDRGAHFYRRNNGVLGSDFWGFGQGYWNGDIMLGGAYHNGTLLKENDVYLNGWLCTDGGDGVGGYVNPGYDKQVYSWFNIKDLKSDRTVQPVTRDYYYQPNSTYITGQSSDLLFHPHYYGTWYTGSGTRLYITRDNGYSYDEVYNFGVNVAAMDLSLSDPSVIYACTFPGWWDKKRIYRSMNGGNTWTEITPAASVINNADDWIPYDIAVDPSDPLKIWIARVSMYGDYPNYNGYSVFSSSNGGNTWTNISGLELNGQYPTNMVHQRGTNGGLYVGTRKGVYYRNAAMPDWDLYNHGLPARIHSAKMATWYRKGRIRNATDRSVWESPFYEPSEPIAIPAIQKQFLFCNRDTAYFTDVSVLNESNAVWAWNFPGGIPSTSTLRNPKVVYPFPGIYDVSLSVTDVNGSDTKVIEDMVIVDNRCEIDTTPGGALRQVNHPDHVKIKDIDISTQTLTITAWIKPSGIQSEYASLFMNDGTAAGLNFRENNNTLAYHWPGGQWWWDSNLTVPPDQWSYVAMVVQPGSVTLYVNGYSATHNIAIEAVDLDDVRIGSYQGWEGRTFRGDMDEVCIWTRALSQDEIRLQRHLIKDPVEDPSIAAYYQFDEGIYSGNIIDKVNGKDGFINGNAAIVPSFASVGSGTSEILNINSPGFIPFLNGGDIGIEFGLTHPGGKVVVSHLWIQPDTLPGTLIPEGGHWIINNYGINQSFSQIEKMSFQKCGSLSQQMAEDFHFNLYTRSSNDFGPVWKQVIPDTTLSFAGVHAVVEFIDLPAITSFSQFLVMRDQVPSGNADIVISNPDNITTTVVGGESISLLMHTEDQGLAMPNIAATTLHAIGSPSMGQFAFLTDSASLIYFNGNAWIKLQHNARLQDQAQIAPSGAVTVSIPQVNSGPSYMLNLANGLVKMPGFSSADISTIHHPAGGMLVFDTTIGKPRFFNGDQWKILSGIATTLPVSADQPIALVGMAVNQDYKHPLSVLELSPLGGKALQLPTVDPQDIFSPVAGLVCYNPSNSSVMLYDGIRWNTLQ